MKNLSLLPLLLLAACASSSQLIARHSSQSDGHDSPEADALCEGGACPLPTVLQAANQESPNWIVTDMDGTERDLGSALDSGRLLALVFWQTWCASCREEFPDLIAASQRHGDKVDFVGVISGPDDLIDDDKVRSVVRQFGLPYPQVRDRDLALMKQFEVAATPTIIVIDSKRRTAYRGNRLPDDWKTLAR